MKTVLLCSNPNFISAKKESEDMQRFMWFSGKLDKGYREVSLTDNENYIVYADINSKGAFNKKLYLKPSRQQGFSFNKETKKLKVWFGTSLVYLANGKLKEALKLLMLEWVVDQNIYLYLTKGLLERILQGKITNPVDAAAYIIRANRFQKTTSPKLLAKWIKDGGDKRLLMSAHYTAKDLNHVIKPTMGSIGDMLNSSTTERLVYDCFKQASILQEKIDFKWSHNRLKQVHTDWTRKIMGFETSLLKDVILPAKKLPKLPPEFEIITSKKRLFEEGTIMDHCVYTNYANEWESGHYCVIHCILKQERITIGLTYKDRGKTSEIDQTYCIGNDDPSLEARNFIKLALQKYLAPIGKYMKEVESNFNQQHF